MKILCVIDSLGSGGAQRQLVELAKGFKEKGNSVSFLIYHDINFFRSDLEKADIPIKLIIEPNYVKRILKIRKAIRKEDPDAVLSFLEGANFMATISGFPYKKWKLVVGERSANPKITKSLKLRFYRWLHLFSDYVVANSQANIDIVKKVNPLLPSGRLKVIYNIVNVPQSIDVKQEFVNKTHLVVAASYRPVKNLKGLIAAIKLLNNTYRNQLRVDWYGNIEDEGYFKDMKLQIEKNNLEKVIFLNEATQNIFEIYKSADFVGLFSHYEGFPNVICEAMALGKPVIVTRVSDITRFVRDNESGFLCFVNDEQSIKNGLMKAIASSKQTRIDLGKRNSEIAKKEFDKETILKKYLKLFVNEE